MKLIGEIKGGVRDMRRKQRKGEEQAEEKILDVDASMQGTINFNDPVNLRINGQFEGELRTKGSLTISQKAYVKANIHGENITIAGRVEGDIVADKQLKIENPGQLLGSVRTPVLIVTEGAILHGNCHMIDKSVTSSDNDGGFYSLDEVAEYLEVDTAKIEEWANEGRIPAVKVADTWKFEKSKIEDWISRQR